MSVLTLLLALMVSQSAPVFGLRLALEPADTDLAMTAVGVSITLFVAMSLGEAVSSRGRHDGATVPVVALETVSTSTSIGTSTLLWLLLLTGSRSALGAVLLAAMAVLFAVLAAVSPTSAASEAFTAAQRDARRPLAGSAAAALGHALSRHGITPGHTPRRRLWARIAGASAGTGLVLGVISTCALAIGWTGSALGLLSWLALITGFVTLTVSMGARGVLALWERRAIGGGRIDAQMHGMLAAGVTISAALCAGMFSSRGWSGAVAAAVAFVAPWWAVHTLKSRVVVQQLAWWRAQELAAATATDPESRAEAGAPPGTSRTN